tara:strand:+ start:26598 stop:26963 length:366 start_codon:yes stop_codon:yes gene_type:complete
MRPLCLVVGLLLAGCAMPTTVQPRDAEGYRALRFIETVRLAGPAGQTWEFAAGTILAGDRRRDRDGALLYCGQMTERQGAATVRPVCAMKRGDILLVHADLFAEGFARPVPAGAIEPFRLR